MSVATITTLKNVRKRMLYTELGSGEQYRRNIEQGRDRIVCEMGDALSAEAFTWECEQRQLERPQMKNQGYEVMISWSKDELEPSSPLAALRAKDQAYLVAKEIAPHSKCWVRIHNDGNESTKEGELGPLHAHITIMNYDYMNQRCIAHGMTVGRIRAINDRMSAERGFWTLASPKKDKSWENVREELDDPFTVALGDQVLAARDESLTLEEFEGALAKRKVDLQKRVHTSEDGTETESWTYRMLDTAGPKRRMRRRKSDKLSTDLSKDGIVAYFAAGPEAIKQQRLQLEAQERERANMRQLAREQSKAQREEVAQSTEAEENAPAFWESYQPSQSDVAFAIDDVIEQKAMADRKATRRVEVDHFKEAKENLANSTNTLLHEFNLARAAFAKGERCKTLLTETGGQFSILSRCMRNAARSLAHNQRPVAAAALTLAAQMTMLAAAQKRQSKISAATLYAKRYAVLNSKQLGKAARLALNEVHKRQAHEGRSDLLEKGEAMERELEFSRSRDIQLSR